MRILGLTLGLLVLFALAPWPMALAAEGVSVDYIGGTVASLAAKSEGKLKTNNDEFLEFRGKQSDVQVSYTKINLLEYGQKVDRRYAMAFLVSPIFILSKSRQHFLTVGYTDEAGRQQAMIFRVAKGSVRSVLVSLEVKTGLKIQFQDGEARKAGKG
jgi:hypothetical protein